jgi:hypothetical protein
MSTNKLIAAIGVLLIVACGVWYWASPLYAMTQLRDAARSGDADRLKEAIDFPSVRDSLKSQVSAQMALQVADAQAKGGFEALGAALAMGMVGPIIDGMVTPQFIAGTIERGKLQRESEAATEGEEAEWSIERDGLDHFRATPLAPDGERVPTLVFDRDGLGWKLVDIDIPIGAFDSPAT